ETLQYPTTLRLPTVCLQPFCILLSLAFAFPFHVVKFLVGCALVPGTLYAHCTRPHRQNVMYIPRNIPRIACFQRHADLELKQPFAAGCEDTVKRPVC
ncbi:hypothetical protein BDV27DRAFT_127658, partial [Aspergillus caelatus]